MSTGYLGSPRVVEEYQEGMLTILRPQCKSCTHYQGYLDGAHRCTAFPLAIPVVILTNEFDHTQPFPGDGGILFEKRSD